MELEVIELNVTAFLVPAQIACPFTVFALDFSSILDEAGPFKFAPTMGAK